MIRKQKEGDFMDEKEKREQEQQLQGWDYSTPIDFRPNRIDMRLDLLDKKTDDRFDTLNRKIEDRFNMLDKKIDDVRRELSGEIKEVRIELLGGIQELNRQIHSMYRWVIGSLVAGPIIAILLNRLTK